MDDRFGAYDAQGIEASPPRRRWQDAHPHQLRRPRQRHHRGQRQAIDSLSQRGLNAMIEPFISRWEDGRIVNDLSEGGRHRSICIAQALGRSSGAHRLKLPAVSDPASMRRASWPPPLPSLILGGEVSHRPRSHPRLWAAALELPKVRGLVVGRSCSTGQ